MFRIAVFVTKKPNIKAKAALGQYYVGYPLQRVHIDILGPLPIT